LDRTDIAWICFNFPWSIGGPLLVLDFPPSCVFRNVVGFTLEVERFRLGIATEYSWFPSRVSAEGWGRAGSRRGDPRERLLGEVGSTPVLIGFLGAIWKLKEDSASNRLPIEFFPTPPSDGEPLVITGKTVRT
jgi:hypothetical protein